VEDERVSQPAVLHLATDVGLWMALPAFGPAFVVVGVVVFVATRDRRRSRAESVAAAEPSDGN
jgi:hypothetical protein